MTAISLLLGLIGDRLTRVAICGCDGMESDKLNRWKDFSYRMARTCYRRRKSPSFTWILEALDQVFEYVEEEGINCFASWDESSHNNQGEEVEALCDWFQKVIEYEVWYRPYDFATTSEAKSLDYWHNKDNDSNYEKIKEKIISRVCEPVRSCVRAGLDMVTGNAGVLL
jgi:hypothetical protein